MEIIIVTILCLLQGINQLAYVKYLTQSVTSGSAAIVSVFITIHRGVATLIVFYSRVNYS